MTKENPQPCEVHKHQWYETGSINGETWFRCTGFNCKGRLETLEDVKKWERMEAKSQLLDVLQLWADKKYNPLDTVKIPRLSLDSFISSQREKIKNV